MNIVSRKNDNRGFTLVELIVVLVILAILAAILIPALIGYIDDARTKQDIVSAKACMTAIQAELTKEYAKNSSSFSSYGDTTAEQDILLYNDSSKYGSFIKNVFDKVGIDKPDIIIFYTLTVTKDQYNTGDKNLMHNAFTVVSLVYWDEENSLPIYYNFDTKEWKEGSPYSDNLIKRGENKIQSGSLKDKKVRIWVLCNKYNKSIIDLNNLILQKMNYKSGGINWKDGIKTVKYK